MDRAKLEEELLSVMDSPRPEALAALQNSIGAAGNPVPDEVADQLETLWEDWCGSTMTPEMARFVLETARFPLPERPFFRKALVAAVKVLLPPYLNHAPVIKAIGVRDDTLPPREIAARFSRLLALKSGSVFFLEASHRWGSAGTVDSINASLPVLPFGMTGGNAVIPLEIVLKDAVVLAGGPELPQLVNFSMPILASRFRAIVAKRALVPVSENVLKLMAQNGCGRKMDPAAFEKYWNLASVSSPAAASAGAGAAAPAAPGTRRSCDGRSLKEMDLLLDKELAAKAKDFADDEVAAFRGFFEKLKPETAKRENKLMASIIGKLSDRASGEKLREMLASLAGKTDFFPAKPENAPFSEFEVWGELPSKILEKLAVVASQVFGEEYLAAMALKLPLKALNCLCPHISDKALCDMVSSRRSCGADLLLWIWKNRKKRSDKELLQLVNLDNISRILSSEEPPKAWGAARRELHAMLMDDQAFQGHLIEMLGGDTLVFGSLLQGALYLDAGERQSLMVKLARQSKELQDYLESGAGQKILSAGMGKDEKTMDAPVNEPTYTSVKSHKALMQELDDIINIHVPENIEALKTARAHGDFRENSEFDAAKERRNYLRRRRSELERELANIQSVIMRQVDIADTAVIGSEIEIRLNSGKTVKYELLGAWDGDPDRNYLSYRTRLGKAVLNKKVGESFEGPDGKPAVLTAVRSLPEAIIAELDA